MGFINTGHAHSLQTTYLAPLSFRCFSNLSFSLSIVPGGNGHNGGGGSSCGDGRVAQAVRLVRAELSRNVHPCVYCMTALLHRCSCIARQRAQGNTNSRMRGHKQEFLCTHTISRRKEAWVDASFDLTEKCLVRAYDFKPMGYLNLRPDQSVLPR